eukprot:EG_transcript_7392
MSSSKISLQRAGHLQWTSVRHANPPVHSAAVVEGVAAARELPHPFSQVKVVDIALQWPFLLFAVAAMVGLWWRLRWSTTLIPECIAIAPLSSSKLEGRVENPEEAAARRLQESKEVEDRLIRIFSLEQLQSYLRAVPDPKHLFVAEVIDLNKCDSGVVEEAEVQWRRTEAEIMAPVVKFKHTFQRTARKCPDVTYIVRDTTPEMRALLQRLEVTLFPTLLFIREGRIVWRHNGSAGAEQYLDDGMAWFGDRSSDGAHLSDLVQELHNVTDLEEFCRPKETTDLLRVVAVMTETSDSCIHMYPAIPAVAKHMKGRATFSRLLADSRPGKEACRKLKVEYVPLMVIFDAQTGQELARHVVSSRGDFMGLFLQSLEKKEAELEAKQEERPALMEPATPEAGTS